MLAQSDQSKNSSTLFNVWLEHLCSCTGFLPEELLQDLYLKAGQVFEKKELLSEVPEWLMAVTMRYLLEWWQKERDFCQSHELWQVDQKYAKLLSHYTMRDIMTLIKAIE